MQHSHTCHNYNFVRLHVLTLYVQLNLISLYIYGHTFHIDFVFIHVLPAQVQEFQMLLMPDDHKCLNETFSSHVQTYCEL